jgi:hypothetical protein
MHGEKRNAYTILAGKPEGNRLRMFENRVMRKIFGPKRDEVTGCWRKVHNEKLFNL